MTEQVILLVEDDENDVLLLKRALVNACVANPLRVVRNGDEAVAYLSGAGTFGDRSRHPLPWLVLLDLQMPRLSGFDVLEWIRCDSTLKDLPVVVVTGLTDMSAARKAYGLGAHSVWLKPVEHDALAQMIRQIREH